MATMRRSRPIAAPVQALWDVITDPHHLPRWWPGVARVEGVSEDRWTQVHLTRAGKAVRADFHLLESVPESRRAWEQEVVGTPFERVLEEAVTEITLEPGEGAVTHVAIEQSQRMRGYSRTGGFLVRRATRKRLDEALAGLDRICGSG